MPFVQLTLVASKEEAEECSDILTEMGALAVSLEDAQDEPLFEPELGTTPLWESTKIIGLFEEKTNVLELQSLLKHQLSNTLFKTLQIDLIEDQDWVRLSLDQFKPQQFGKNLWICPTWCEVPDHNATIVKLDPGLAFGTGTHPTTQLCLEWLSEHPPINALAFDYGCGSGILGIAALKLGAKQVIAIDHDPQALLSTHDNAKLNGLIESQLQSYLPDEFRVTEKADLILANILADPLLQLATHFADIIKTKGQIVLSGILLHQVDAIKTAYQAAFEQFSVSTSAEWARIIAVRK
jgi:ribosomal protein L11 methyltransferase